MFEKIFLVSRYNRRTSDLEGLKLGNRFRESRGLVGVDDFFPQRRGYQKSFKESSLKRSSSLSSLV